MSVKPPVKLSVVMPVYSETESVARAAAELMLRVPADVLHEIVIVVHPRSSVDSLAICRDLESKISCLRVLTQQRLPGVGHAFREGMATTTGTHVLLIGSDGESDTSRIPLMLAEQARTGADIVTCSRWMEGGGFAGYGVIKVALNGAFQLLVRALFNTSLTDVTFCYRILSAAVARGTAWECAGHEFALETILRPILAGAVVAEVPVRWTRRTAGESKNPLYRNIRYVTLLFRLRFFGR